MPHLQKPRNGWTNQHIAAAILSKFSFIAEPSSSIADDIGFDFFCTLFKIYNGKYPFLLPENSFAIQIKSNYDKIDITNKTKFLDNLEVPYFVGVVDNNNLKIYSGESICHFFALYGNPTDPLRTSTWYRMGNKIYIELMDSFSGKFFNVEEKEDKYIFKVEFPKILELSTGFDYLKSPERIDLLFKYCTIIQKNLSKKNVGSYMFKSCRDTTKIVVYTGKGSAKSSQINFLKSFGEFLFNLMWIYKKYPALIDLKLFEILKCFYTELHNYSDGKLLPTLIDGYERLKKVIDKK